jgi:hypothetical protein
MAGDIDLKAVIIYVGAVIIGDFNQAVQAVGLLLNVFYIGYQLRLLHKKNKKEFDEDNKE